MTNEPEMTLESASKTVAFLEAPYNAISKEAAIKKAKAEGFIAGHAAAFKERDVYREALKKIAGEDRCGCRPVCLCSSESDLRIWKEEIKSLASEALLKGKL